MFVFAAMSFYWAAGGTAGSTTLGTRLEELAHSREPDFVAVLWITGLLKFAGGVLALALVHRRAPRRLLLVAAWGAAALLLLYAVANLVQHGLIVAGAIEMPAGLGDTAARWHLLFWDPFWLLGGVLTALAAREFSRG
jgi:predicted MFS family arabinose efflux permease